MSSRKISDISIIYSERILQDLLQQISHQVWIITSKALWTPGKAENSIIKHKEMIQTIRKKNLRQLKQTLKRHILSAKQIVIEEAAKPAET